MNVQYREKHVEWLLTLNNWTGDCIRWCWRAFAHISVAFLSYLLLDLSAVIFLSNPFYLMRASPSHYHSKEDEKRERIRVMVKSNFKSIQKMWCVFIVRREVILVFILKIEAVKQNRRKFKKKKTKKQFKLSY